MALGSFVPPKERRGLVFVDPPFEDRDNFGKLVAGLKTGYRRWPNGIYVLWCPVKDLSAIDSFRVELARSSIKRLWRGELLICNRAAFGRLNVTGQAICNPPWQKAERPPHRALAALLPTVREAER